MVEGHGVRVADALNLLPAGLRAGRSAPFHRHEFTIHLQGRVRDVRYDRDLDRLAALGTEGCIKLFDLEHDMRATRTVSPPPTHTPQLRVCPPSTSTGMSITPCTHSPPAAPSPPATQPA